MQYMLLQCFVHLVSSLCYPTGVLTQGGGVFGTFVSSFFLQFSRDGNQWHTHKELVTDAPPRAKVQQQTKALYFKGFIIFLSDCSPPRFFSVITMIEE